MPEKRGRPPFKPTAAQRATVEQMRYCGESLAVIARALVIDEDTLSKHFPEELAGGHAKRRREVVGFLFASARKGNVTAQKKLEEMGRGLHLTRSGSAGDADDSDATDASTARLGKKATAKADAEAGVAAGGKFAPRGTPRLASVNGRPIDAND